MTTSEQSASLIRGYRFEFIFSIFFTLYCWICYGFLLSQWLMLPLGFLNFLFIVGVFSRENPLIFLVAAFVIGFVVGWIMRTLWSNGWIGRIGLIILLMANAVLFYYLLTLT